MKLIKLDKEKVRIAYNYDSNTGILTNKSNRRGVVVGNKVGSPTSKGHLFSTLDGKSFPTHKICFLHYHGHLPEFIDHINGVRDDNRIKNLRGCTACQNQQNSKIQTNNTSGIKGVSWNKASRMWHTIIMSDNKKHFLGYFYDKEVAGQVVRIKRLELHGEFANHGEHHET